MLQTYRQKCPRAQPDKEPCTNGYGSPVHRVSSWSVDNVHELIYNHPNTSVSFVGLLIESLVLRNSVVGVNETAQ